QAVVYARMGNNHNMVYDMAKESTKSLGVFTEKDMESMLGHRIVIAYDDTRSNSTIAEGVLDDYAPLMVSNDAPVSVYLPTGNHTFMLNERNTRYPLKFNVQYPRSFVIYHTDLGPTIGDRYTETSGPVTTYISFKGYIGERPDYYRFRIDGGKEQSEFYGKTAPYDLTLGDHRIEMQQVKMGLVSTKTTYRTEFHVKIRPNTNYSLKVVDGNLTLVPTND
ncbi:MAG: hypothetical protein MJZ68_06400, partial [archaeon]|nr:hypothetical protein [archaeon]